MAAGEVPAAAFPKQASLIRTLFTRIIMCVILIVLTSCGNGSNAEDGLLTREEYRTALGKTLNSDEWPDNYQPDADRIVDRTYPDDGSVQEGMELTIHSVFLVCAWSLQFMDGYQSGNAESQDLAISYLHERIPSSPVVREEMRDLAMRLGTDASIGDLEEMTGFLDQNCYPLDWIENPISGPSLSTRN